MNTLPFQWFYSDPHYGHANIIQHANRPFANVDVMNTALEAYYRLAVKPDDTVLWCGDCAWTNYDLGGLLGRLPGRKWLVRGNHDGQSTAFYLRAGFDLVTDRLTVRLGGKVCIVSHYPPQRARYEGHEYDDRFLDKRPPKPGKGHAVIHGHTHERCQFIDRRVHVGVDAWYFAPASVGAVERGLREGS